MSSANACSERPPYCFATRDARWPIRHLPASAEPRAARPSATSRPQFGPREEAREVARRAARTFAERVAAGFLAMRFASGVGRPDVRVIFSRTYGSEVKEAL